MNFLDSQIVFMIMQHKEHVCKKGSHPFFIVIHSVSAFGPPRDLIKQLLVGAAVCCLKHRFIVHRTIGVFQIRTPLRAFGTYRWVLRWRNRCYAVRRCRCSRRIGTADCLASKSICGLLQNLCWLRRCWCPMRWRLRSGWHRPLTQCRCPLTRWPLGARSKNRRGAETILIAGQKVGRGRVEVPRHAKRPGGADEGLGGGGPGSLLVDRCGVRAAWVSAGSGLRE